MKSIVAIVWLGLWIGAASGWVLNIVDLFHTSFDPLTGLAVLRVVGIFVPPLGAILGWFW